jgi:hypothetical protein
MVERVHRSRMTALPWMTPLPGRSQQVSRNMLIFNLFIRCCPISWHDHHDRSFAINLNLSWWMTALPSKVKNEITPEQNMLQIPKSNLSFLPLMVPDLVYICQMLYLKQNLNYWAKTKCGILILILFWSYFIFYFRWKCGHPWKRGHPWKCGHPWPMDTFYHYYFYETS